MLRLAPDAPAVNNFSEQTPTIFPRPLLDFTVLNPKKGTATTWVVHHPDRYTTSC